MLEKGSAPKCRFCIAYAVGVGESQGAAERRGAAGSGGERRGAARSGEEQRGAAGSGEERRGAARSGGERRGAAGSGGEWRGRDDISMHPLKKSFSLCGFRRTLDAVFLNSKHKTLRMPNYPLRERMSTHKFNCLTSNALRRLILYSMPLSAHAVMVAEA